MKLNIEFNFENLRLNKQNFSLKKQVLTVVIYVIPLKK